MLGSFQETRVWKEDHWRLTTGGVGEDSYGIREESESEEMVEGILTLRQKDVGGMIKGVKIKRGGCRKR